MNEITNQDFIDEIEANGGFVFPCSASLPQGGTLHSHGLTLRDYFAGQIVAEVGRSADAWVKQHSTEVSFGAVARDAYALADAMLLERAKRKEGA